MQSKRKKNKKRALVLSENLFTESVADFRPVRLDLSAESAAIQQYFSLTTNQ
jgi:hypothetical protein